MTALFNIYAGDSSITSTSAAIGTGDSALENWSPMDPKVTQIPDAGFALQEYRSLRETIQTRGALRVGIAIATWSVWSALSLWSWTSVTGSLVGLVPLFVLVAGFEAVLALHTGVERIGRYVQRVFETGGATPPAWEHIAVAMGPRWLSPGGLDPVFSVLFLLATWLNFIPAAAGADSVQLTIVTFTHGAFIIRVVMARRFVGRQRAADLAALESVISSNSLVSRIQQQR